MTSLVTGNSISAEPVGSTPPTVVLRERPGNNYLRQLRASWTNILQFKRMHTKEEKESDILANANIYFDFVNVFFIRGFAFYCRLSILKVYFITQAPSQVEKHITKARRIQN